MSQPVVSLAGTWLHRQNNVICKVTVRPEGVALGQVMALRLLDLFGISECN